MPQLIPVALGAGFGAAGAFAAGTSILFGAISGALLTGVQVLLASVGSGDQKTSVERRIQRADVDTPRRTVYGRERVSGALVFYKEAAEGYLHHYVITVANHSIEEYTEVWLGDERIWSSASGGTYDEISAYDDGTTWDSVIELYFRTGLDNQVVINRLKNEVAIENARQADNGEYEYDEDADQWYSLSYIEELDTNFSEQTRYKTTTVRTAISPSAAPTSTEWTDDHRLRGVAYVYARIRPDFIAMPNGPDFRMSFVIKGKNDIYDPRDMSTGYSENAALIVADYLQESDIGLNADATEIDNTALAVAANLCDEQVPLFAGGTEGRYLINGIVDADADPKSVLEDFADAMAGKIIYSGGKFVIVAGAYQPASFSIDEDDFVGPVSVSTNIPRSSRYNVVSGMHVASFLDFVETEYPQVRIASAVTSDGEEIRLDLSLPYTKSNAATQRIAKIKLLQLRRAESVKCILGPRAIGLQIGETVEVSIGHYGWVNKTFEVEGWAPLITEEYGMAFEVSLRAATAADWDWVEAEEAANDAVKSPNRIANPTPKPATGFQLITQQELGVDGTLYARLIAAGSPPPPTASGRFHYEIGVELDGRDEGRWTVGEPRLEIPIAPNLAGDSGGSTYNAWVEVVDPVTGLRSPRVNATPVQVVPDTTAPASPTLQQVLARPGGFLVATSIPSDKDLKEIWLYRSGGTNPDLAQLIWRGLQSKIFIDGSASDGEQNFWVRAVDHVGNQSGFSNSLAQTAGETQEEFVDTSLIESVLAAGDGLAMSILSEPARTSLSALGRFPFADPAAWSGDHLGEPSGLADANSSLFVDDATLGPIAQVSGSSVDQIFWKEPVAISSTELYALTLRGEVSVAGVASGRLRVLVNAMDESYASVFYGLIGTSIDVSATGELNASRSVSLDASVSPDNVLPTTARYIRVGVDWANNGADVGTVKLREISVVEASAYVTAGLAQAAVQAEETARIAADSAEASARTTAIATLDGDLSADIAAEEAARIAAVSAEASARATSEGNLESYFALRAASGGSTNEVELVLLSAVGSSGQVERTISLNTSAFNITNQEDGSETPFFSVVNEGGESLAKLNGVFISDAVIAEKLLVGAQAVNLFPTPNWTTLDGWNLSNGSGNFVLGATSTVAQLMATSGSYLRVLGGSDPAGSVNSIAAGDRYYFPVEPGRKIAVRWRARYEGGGRSPSTLRIGIEWLNAAGAHYAQNYSATIFDGDTLSTGYEVGEDEFTAPVDAAQGRVVFRHVVQDNGSDRADFNVGYVEIRRQSGGVFIEDGAITANKVTAETIEAYLGSFAVIDTGVLILDNEIITSDQLAPDAIQSATQIDENFNSTTFEITMNEQDVWVDLIDDTILNGEGAIPLGSISPSDVVMIWAKVEATYPANTRFAVRINLSNGSQFSGNANWTPELGTFIQIRMPVSITDASATYRVQIQKKNDSARVLDIDHVYCVAVVFRKATA